MNKTLFIVNPVAGAKRGMRRWSEFEKSLRRHEYPFNVCFTSRIGDAKQRASDALRSGTAFVVAFGGDGTLNEVVNGFMSVPEQMRSSAQIGFVPAGSSNDFRRSIGVSPEFSPGNASEGSAVSLDVGRIECRDHLGKPIERYFLVNASLGVLPQALEFFNRRTPGTRILKRASLDLTVIASGIRAIVRHRIRSYALCFNGIDWVERRLTNLSLLRGVWFGGGMSYGAASRPGPGLFSVVGINELSVVRRAMIMPLFYTGGILRHPAVWTRESAMLEVRSEYPGAIEADGELVGFLPAQFTIVPNALKMTVWESI